MVWRTPSVVHHRWVNACTIRCSQGTNLPLMKLLIHFVALYSTHLQLVLVSLANCSPIDCTPSSPGEQCESQMFFSLSLSLSHLITQISFQISRFSSGVWNTVWFFFLGRLQPSYFMFWEKFETACLSRSPRPRCHQTMSPHNASNRCS